jgi:hypothetical protein
MHQRPTIRRRTFGEERKGMRTHVARERSIITGKDGRHEEATKGPNKILPRSARH